MGYKFAVTRDVYGYIPGAQGSDPVLNILIPSTLQLYNFYYKINMGHQIKYEGESANRSLMEVKQL
jgi:hypothetical protein